MGHCFLLSISSKVGYCFGDPDPEFVTTAPHFWILCPASEPAVELHCFEVVRLIRYGSGLQKPNKHGSVSGTLPVFYCVSQETPFCSVLRIRDVYPRSRSFYPGKFFLSSRNYDSRCLSRVSAPGPWFFPIPDPDPGSRGKIEPYPQHWFWLSFCYCGLSKRLI